jgi:hypothetical protein
MPRRRPRLINGISAIEFDRRLHDEYNETVRIARYISGVREWRTNRFQDSWSAVQWRARHLAQLRSRVINSGFASYYYTSRLPNPSLLEQLPRDWWIGDIIGAVVDVPVELDTRFGRSTDTLQETTSQIALESVVVLEADLEQFTFGVEIECYLPRGTSRYEMTEILQTSGVNSQVEPYNHFRRGHWKVVTDGSLGDYERGCEVVSPILRGRAGIEEMRKVCKLLDEKGCTVRRRCGFHVHVGARDRDVNFFRNLLNLYGHYESAIDTITSRSRRGSANDYCRSTREQISNSERRTQIDAATTVAELALWYAGNDYDRRYSRTDNLERFLKVNLAAYWRHGTVEFRQHQGTVSADKAEHWVKVCLRLVSAAVAGAAPDGEDTLQNLASKIKIPAEEMAFLERRVVELNRVRNERR